MNTIRQALMRGDDQKLFFVPAPNGITPHDLERENPGAGFIKFCDSREQAESLITCEMERSGWGCGL